MPQAGLIVRDAVEADIAAVVALLADDVLGVTRERPAADVDPAYLRAFAEIAAQPGNTILVAEEAGEVVACLQLFFIPSITLGGTKRAEIEGVRASSSRRGQGLGKLLIEAAFERARAAGCGLVQLACNRQREDAQRFYESLGFVPSHVGFKKRL